MHMQPVFTDNAYIFTDNAYVAGLYWPLIQPQVLTFEPTECINVPQDKDQRSNQGR